KVPEEKKRHESVWATQAYANYSNNMYSVPMGGFAYTQDESAEQIYANTEYAAISRFNDYIGDNDPTNYLTTYQIKALYAGLLRNAAVVTYDLYDAETGEIIRQNNVYRVNKAYSGAGSAVPAQVLLELDPEELGLVNNGKYALDFYFYFNQEKYEAQEKNEDNTFSMTFYVDYEAPVLVDSRIRYIDHPDSTGRGNDWQSVYLDLDIYDNTYAQAVILCYNDNEDVNDATELKLVTDYITPVYNPKKNGTTTVSIDITNLMAQYEKYKDRLYIQIDDYALNHRVLTLDFTTSSANTLPSEFEVLGGTDITLGVNETYKVGLSYEGSANLSNFTWTTGHGESFVKVFNGEIFGVSPTRTRPETVTVIGANGASKTINVTVVDNGKKLTFPNKISFGLIESSGLNLVKATGTVKIRAGQEFTLDVSAEPWYYDLANYTLVWSSSVPDVAEVDQNGKVTVKNKKGSTKITAAIYDSSNPLVPKCSADVTLAVQEPFTVSNFTLTKYSGTGETIYDGEGNFVEDGVVKIPDDKNIMTIAEDAFKDNIHVKKVIIPKTVTTIDKRAFTGCTNLKEVYFIQETAKEIPDANLTSIMRFAFEGCVNLEKLDLSNCKTITVDRSAFEGCVKLSEIVSMDNIGTMLSRAFAGCTSLTDVDITGLHVAGASVFEGCTALKNVTTGFYTAIGVNMFNGCNAIKEITLNAKTVEASAFANCKGLNKVTFGKPENGEKVSDTYIIGAHAFDGCTGLTAVDFNGNKVTEIGDMAFANCGLSGFTVPAGLTRFGDRVFHNTSVALSAVYSGDTLLLAPKNAAGFTLQAGTKKIAPYAFSGCTLSTVNLTGITSIGEGAFASSTLSSITIPSTVNEIGDYAFAGTNLTSVTIPANVEKIGAGAFAGCESLTGITFENNSLLKSIGSAAFSGCTGLTEVSLPDGVETMGSNVFSGCTGLTTVEMPSVKDLGAYTFVGCINLEEVTFGENAETVGDYTFGSSVFQNGEIRIIACEKLTTVEISDVTLYIGEGAFLGCTALETIDLKNVTELGTGAFYGCTALKTVDLEGLEIIGGLAFYNCTGLTELNLTNAKVIGERAFFGGEYTEVSIPKAESVGNFAFYGGCETTVEIPVSLKTLGYGAFANSKNLNSFTVEAGESKFKAVDGVLYSTLNTIDKEESLELTDYPSAKVADDGTYNIVEGTATVKAYAMSDLVKGAVVKVVIPYSVKTIGDAAFFASGISEYQFEAINAPQLLAEFYYLGEYEYEYADGTIEVIEMANFTRYTTFTRNFETNALDYTAGYYHPLSIIITPEVSKLKISYPSNGSGYDNFVYQNYFGTKADLGELMDDNTRKLIKLVTSFDLDEIKSWNTLEDSVDNKKMVTDFSKLVISAHELYNILASDTQKAFFGDENEQKLFDVENELRTVKQHLGIKVAAKSFGISDSSKHKTVYREGEKFSMKGLVLTVTYEDYSTELADMSKVIIESSYDGRELSTLNTYVILQGIGEYAGLQINLPIEVTERGANGGTNANGLVIGLAVGGSVLGLIVIAAAVILILKYKFKIDVIGKIFKKPAKAEAENSGSVENEEE
ncbi:MAG: leucine-rich repeat protein, partial [Clostridia bacterium]|nr:leucine-rich repeat protein [Clostridia bacterium]